MHPLSFGHSFAALVAPILLSVLAFNFLNKKKSSVRRSAEDADTGASGSSTAPMGSDSGASSSSTPQTGANKKGASSSSTTPTRNCYEVFLSFRGPDTRKVFTDHLYKGLVDAGILVFRDDDELRQGEEIGPDPLAAIKNSKILIPILSPNYGSSSWCLDELVEIMECKRDNMGQIVLPIFYKVKPADVGHQIGSFGYAFHERERRLLDRGFDPTILKKWKQALKEVSSLKGAEGEGYEGELVNLAVQKVLIELKKDFELVTAKNLIGIDSHAKRVMKFVDNNSSATLFVGIHGMGGIGKTTLAKTIYNKLSNQFAYHSFIADIRDLCERNSLKYLQNQLIFDILKKRIRVNNEDEGSKFISSKFKGKKVLILLDDVDDDYQLKALAGNHNWFSSGSRIIITTRYEGILDNAGVDYKHEHLEMDWNQSLILFSRHAFRRDAPPSEFEVLTRDVVSTTGGLPLSLEVLGSFLHGKRLIVWRITINKLRKVPYKIVREKLRIIYEALGDAEKQIFLDIACFCMGTDARIASYMWDACDFFPENGIDVLQYMSLIKVGDNHELCMHDQLRDLGREIVREENRLKPQYRSRLWNSYEVPKVLKENKGTEKIEAIYLSKGSSECSGNAANQGGDIYTSKQFKNLTRLRFLHVSGAHFMGDFENSFKELRWLRWWNCPSTFEANNFHVMELVVLDLSWSGISDKWEGWRSITMAKKLKFLDLTSCQSLRSTVFLSAFKNLEVLILHDCKEVEQIDSSIGDMKNLVRLDLSGCRRLKELPVEMGKLEALKELLLKGTEIIELPDTIGGLQNLEILNISGIRIKELPNSIGRLRKLRDLDASRCMYLGGEMLRSMNNFSSLQHLDFNGCNFIEILNVSQLNHLKTLSAKGCKKLLEVRGLDKLKYLESLSITGSTSIERLDLSKSESLRILYANNCTNLVEIQGLDRLESLEELYIPGCASIARLNLPKSESLKILYAKSCENLDDIQGLDRLHFLEELCLSECASIEWLNLSKSNGLKRLYAENCVSLVEIQGLDWLEFLEELNISGCASIERLDLPKSERLKILDVGHCGNLVEIQGLDRLEFVEELYIPGCASIKRLNLPKSESLKKLHAENCKNLVEIRDIDRLEFLKELWISECIAIERLDLRKSKLMKILDARNCKKLVEIEGLDGLKFLEELDISECASIERLDLPKSNGLKIIDADSCKNLVKIHGLDRLEFLEALNISECALINRLDLPKSESLNKLYAENCKSLVEIQGLDRLEFLEELHISGCVSMKRLDLPKSESLNKLYAENCESLVEIQGLDGLEFLEELYISGCASIERLDVSKSKGLNKLYAENCKNLVEIQGLDGLEFLEEVYISGCTSIERLDVSKSKGLNKLYAENCKNLVEIQGLDGLEFLEEVYISGCASLKGWIFDNPRV